jgi:hypothetical protein
MTAGGENATAAGVTDRESRTPPHPEDPGSRRAAGVGPPAADTAPGRRPWWIWAVPFAVLFTVLCVRNRFLFTTRLYEQGDGGANSILIEQAKHFTLLVGNYSRERFNHPGPAYMYVQALGEYLFQNALHVVPTAWNAHLLSVFALDCAFVSLAAGIAYGWTRSLRGAGACLAVFAGFAIAYPPILNSDWMPYMYVLAYMVFLIAAASVAAGRAQDAWIFALTGWFLIHGHACFLLFVPAVTAAVLAGVLWPCRHTLRASVRGFFREQRRNWIPVAVVSALFALPIVVNLVLHWPGDFGKYLSYGGSGRAGGHSPRQVIEYALWFWWPHHHAWLAPLLGYPAALAAVRWLSPPRLRGFLLAMLAVNVVSSLAFLLYAAAGIDDLTQYYIGYFYWSAPLITVLAVVLAAFEAVPRKEAESRKGALAARLSTGAALLAAAAGVAVLAVIPGTRTSTNDIDRALPRVVSALAARAPGQTIVLHIDHPAWVETTGFLVQAERSGVRACLDDPWYTFLMTRQFICTPAQAASGRAYWFYTPGGLPPHAPVLLRFSGIAVVAASP